MVDYKYIKYKTKYLEKLNMKGGNNMSGGGILLKRIDPGVELNTIELIQLLQNTDKNFKIVDDNNETIFHSLKDINIGTHIVNRFENIENYTMTELHYDNNYCKFLREFKTEADPSPDLVPKDVSHSTGDPEMPLPRRSF